MKPKRRLIIAHKDHSVFMWNYWGRLIVVSSFLTALAGCGGSQSNSITPPTKSYSLPDAQMQIDSGSSSRAPVPVGVNSK